MKIKKKKPKELDLIVSADYLNPEALEELSNGLEEGEELIVGAYGDQVVGATNNVFSPLCNVIIKSPNFNPRSTASQFGVKNNKIDRITIHHMAGNLSVEACGKSFALTSRQASSNYGIGTDGRIGGYVGEENRSWCSASRDNDFRAITIEVANNTLSPNWTVSEAALTSLYNLLVDVCRRNGIEKLIYSDNKDDRINQRNGCNVTWHSDFAPTGCASPYIKSIIKNIVTVVNNLLGQAPVPTPQPTPAPAPTPTPVTPSGTPDPYADYSKAIWDFYRTLGMPEYGVSGIIGNLACESGLRPNNLQNSFEKKLNMNDDQYTAAVDTGTYKNFVNDGAGYGLAQWTYYTRKQGLLDFAKQCKMSICDINLQLTYLTQELQTKYSGVWNKLFAAKSVFEASNIMLLEFEKPADQSVSAQQKRAACCQGYYDKFAGSAITTAFPIGSVVQADKQINEQADKQISEQKVEPYLVKITAQILNVRSGAGINYPVKTTVKKNNIYTIIAMQGNWGKLKSGAGWIDLRYTKRVGT